jgi:hypothetical protein
MHGLHRRLLLLLLLLASGRRHGPGQVRQAAATGLLVVLLLRAGSTPPLPHRPIFAATSTSLPLRVAASPRRRVAARVLPTSVVLKALSCRMS